MKLDMIQKWFGTVICFVFVYKNFLHENFATDQDTLIVQSTLEIIQILQHESISISMKFFPCNHI